MKATNTRLLMLLLGCALAYAFTIGVAPRSFSGRARQFKVQLDREAAIARAREIAGQLGYETSNWKAMVSTRLLEGDVAMIQLTERPSLPPATPDNRPHLLSAIVFNVQLQDGSSDRSLRVELTSSGKLRRLLIGTDDGPRSPGPPSTMTGAPPIQNGGDPEASEPEPESRLTDLEVKSQRLRLDPILQSLIPQFDFRNLSLSDSSYTRESSEIRYQLPSIESDGSDGPNGVDGQVLANPMLAVGLRNGELERITYVAGMTRELRAIQNNRVGRIAKWMGNLDEIYAWVLILLVMGYFFVALAFKRMQVRRTAPFIGLMMIGLLVSSISGEFSDSMLMDMRFRGVGRLPGWAMIAGPWSVFIVFITLVSLLGYVIYVTGLSISIRIRRRKTLGLELLLQGRLLTKPVTRSLMYGIACGGMVSAIPLLVVRSGIFSGVSLDIGRLEGHLAGRLPVLAGFGGVELLICFTLFSVLAPLIERAIGRRWLRHLVIVGVSLLILLGIEVVESPAPALFTSALLGSILLTAIYTNFELLGVMTALLASRTLNAGIILLAQPIPSLQSSGRQTLLVIAVSMIIAAIGLRVSRPVRPGEIEIPASLLESQAERERLKAEFEIARRAQQQLLPLTPPEIKSYDIAGICLPSREVGGDFYDFITFPDGRTGIVVADVSGKGVSAALFMTLTKGLISSLVERLTDPGEILSAVNEHLYVACRRRMFVTLFLGILDPGKNSLTYARAGHNPPILYRTADEKSELLDSRGIGLGLCGSSIFSPALVVKSVELNPGDLVAFYSDGITEAMAPGNPGNADNPGNEEFEIDGLTRSLHKYSHQSAAEIRDGVIADVSLFLGKGQAQDDQTLVILRRLAS